MPNFKCSKCSDVFDSHQKTVAHEWAKHQRKYTAKSIQHGTKAGYLMHKRRDDRPCSECLTAWRNYYNKTN